ncbi:hypothetical protein LMG14418_0146 [Lactococcus lactis subsp. lactis]|nr:hypothetical protein LMG14418_0146 [Lactococcus lactis subsp. lactis]
MRKGSIIAFVKIGEHQKIHLGTRLGARKGAKNSAKFC